MPISSGPVPADLARALADRVDAALAALGLPDAPADLYDPVRYVLAAGGKRVRPVLTLLTARAFGGEDAAERALPAALAVETFHNFTLVHDDIMDRAPTRRGRLAVHVAWDESTAILAGDLLMGLAYRLLDETPFESASVAREARRAFHDMVARLCEGQALDLRFERRSDVTVDDYLDMIDRKTGALLVFALDLGGLVGGASEDDRQSLRRAGRALGRAFQIQDDLLDLTAESETWGKAVGGDLLEGKRTYLVLRALERAGEADRTWFDRVLDGGLPQDEVEEARGRMDRLGVLEDARQAVAAYTRAGEEGLAVLPAGTASDVLRSLALGLARRVS